MGYQYKEETYERRGTEGKMVLMKTVTKEVPPATCAQIFWLKNRRPDLWRDKSDHLLSGDELKPLKVILTSDGNK